MNRLWSTARGGLAIRTGGFGKIITAPFSRGNGGLSVPLMNFEKIAGEVCNEQAGGVARFFGILRWQRRSGALPQSELGVWVSFADYEKFDEKINFNGDAGRYILMSGWVRPPLDPDADFPLMPFARKYLT